VGGSPIFFTSALVGRHIGLQLVFPAPEQLEAPAVPDDGVEGREEAQLFVDLVPSGHRVLVVRRRMGHYAMPMLWGEQMLGWANLKVVDGQLQHELGFVGPHPRGRAFQPTLDEALQQMQEFLGL
jgi:hypothetical protein